MLNSGVISKSTLVPDKTCQEISGHEQVNLTYSWSDLLQNTSSLWLLSYFTQYSVNKSIGYYSL